MVRENQCSSYRRFELMSDFYKEVSGNVQGTAGNSSRQEKFELSGVRVTRS